MSAQDKQIKIGDKTYTIRFSVRALTALQEHWGLKSFQEVAQKMSKLNESVSIDDLVGFVWAGLRTHHREMTKEDVLDLIDELGMENIESVFSEALVGALPQGSVKKKGEAETGAANP